jgi:chromate reductase, NAD(P)H dehydrogenase (quinone)
MRILGLSGSLRRDSHNTRLLRGLEGALPAGVELEVYDGLAEIPPFSQDEELDAPAAVVALKEAIAAADAVIVATPEYNGSIPGHFKNVLDWVSRPRAESPIQGKPAAVIGASTGLFGAVWAQAEMRKVLGTMGASVLDRELPIGYADESLGEDGVPVDGEAAQALREILAELADAAAEPSLTA